MITKTCEQCGEPFQVYPSQSSQRFCCTAHYQEWRTGKKLNEMEFDVEEFKKLTVVSAIEISRAKAERIYNNLNGISGITYHLVATYDQD